MVKKVKSTLYISEDKREKIRRSGLSLCRKVGCTNNDGLKHLKNLARLNIVHFYAGRHAFARSIEKSLRIE